MKKILSLAGIIALAVVFSSNAYAGTKGTGISGLTTEKIALENNASIQVAAFAGQTGITKSTGSGSSMYGYHSSNHVDKKRKVKKSKGRQHDRRGNDHSTERHA